jgi:iron(III) transport system substrate-binding protein
LLLTRDWKSLGVDPALSPTPYAVAATAALGVLVWNKQRVADGDLPKTWDEMLAERWRGKIGQWVRAATLGTLAKAYGEQHMRDYVRKLIDLKAMIYPSTFQLAQQVAAGEVDIGMGLYHSAQPVIASGAPLGLRFLDPTPVNTLYGAVVTKGGNPEGAQVLLAWLSTPEGAKAYEAAIGRGNPLIKGTETAERLGTRKLVEYSFAEAATIEKRDAELTQMLMAAEKKR